MNLIGIAGWSGSGKTTLLTRLLPVLTGHGLRVSTIKHAHHRFDMDREGKDSFRHRASGAHEVMISSRDRWALMHEHRSAPEASLSELLQRMDPVDLILIEGFKKEPHDKIEVYRPALQKPLLARDDPHVVAVACDGEIADCPVPQLPLNEVDDVAGFILRYMQCDPRPPTTP